MSFDHTRPHPSSSVPVLLVRHPTGQVSPRTQSLSANLKNAYGPECQSPIQQGQEEEDDVSDTTSVVPEITLDSFYHGNSKTQCPKCQHEFSHDCPLGLSFRCKVKVLLEGVAKCQRLQLRWMPPHRGCSELNEVIRMLLEVLKTPQNKGTIYFRYGSCRIVGSGFSIPYDRFERDPIDHINSDLGAKIYASVLDFHRHRHDTPFSIEVFCEYDSVQLEPTGKRYSEVVKKALNKKIKCTMFEGKKYVPRSDILPFLVKEVLINIVQDDPVSLDTSKFVDWITAKQATRLAIACVYEGVGMPYLHHLLDQGFDDGNWPSSDIHPECVGDDDCEKYVLDKLFACRGMFAAEKFGGEISFRHLKPDDVLPLHYPSVASHGKGKREILGDGQYGRVEAVQVDPVHHLIPGRRDRVFALKVSHKTGDQSHEFAAEIQMLSKLAKLGPHNFLVQHIASWTWQERFYILYPKAECNLRQYVMATEHKVSINHIELIRMLHRMIGLVDAVYHIHSRGRKADADDHVPYPGYKPKTGYHHDIKLDNILVFRDAKTNKLIWKLGDFGCGKFQAREQGIKDGKQFMRSRATKDARGTLTYLGPDIELHERGSRPLDIWALACCFLELWIWFFDGCDEVNGLGKFQDERHWISETTQADDDIYYVVSRETLAPVDQRTAGGITLRPLVDKRLSALKSNYWRHFRPDALSREDHDDGAISFARVRVSMRQMFEIDPDCRINASDLLTEMSEVTDELENHLMPSAVTEGSSLPESNTRRSISGAVTPISPDLRQDMLGMVDSTTMYNDDKGGLLTERTSPASIEYQVPLRDHAGSPASFLSHEPHMMRREETAQDGQVQDLEGKYGFSGNGNVLHREGLAIDFA